MNKEKEKNGRTQQPQNRTALSELLVFTDLDGTLLGHEDYSFQINLPLLTNLQKAGVTVVPATSKTQRETMIWLEKLCLKGPAIVENGSAIIFPDRAPTILGVSMPELDTFLDQYRDVTTSFIGCPLSEAMTMTGLTASEAEAARDRHYSIPFVLKDPVLETQLRDAAQAAGLRIIRGGRFLHLQGQCDKQTAVQVLADSSPHSTVMALGDNENDRAMLAAADVAVVVNTAEGHLLELDHAATVYTKAIAPTGWQEGVAQALQHLGLALKQESN